jgi:hypothetical protein
MAGVPGWHKAQRWLLAAAYLLEDEGLEHIGVCDLQHTVWTCAQVKHHV